MSHTRDSGLVRNLHSSDEDEETSSVPESCYSEDEDNFLDGIDPQQDITSEDDSWQSQRSDPGVMDAESPTCQSRRHHHQRPATQPPPNSNQPQPATRWKTEKVPDSLPQPLPRFIPKRNPGVQQPLIGRSPLQLFKNFFDHKTVKIICENTNKQAKRNIAKGRRFKWTDLSRAEFFKFLGLVIYMGILNMPKLRDMWRVKSIFHVPFPRRVMSRDRFLAISRNLHMSDQTKDVENDQKVGTPAYDPLHRIKPLYDSIRIACKSVYHPRQNLSVDERMVATKAKLGIKQYIKNKPSKWGIKLFVLADSNGYTVDFSVYAGKSRTASGNGLSFDVVMALVNKDYLGSGYHIYCDNYYTSPALFRRLSDLGFGACGTYRDGRLGTPTTKKNALTKTSQRGSVRWIREGKLLFVKWMDTREVSVCSTIHTAYSGETVVRGRKTSDGGYERMSIPRPTAISEYNRYMGGVDLSDQLLGYYSVHHKTMKWYRTLFFHFVDIAATNSYILHKELCAAEERPMTHQAFQEHLAAELLGVPLDFSYPDRVYAHVPVAIAPGKEASEKATKGRRKCALCKRSTPFMCKACLVPLCMILDRNCHETYHS